MSFFYNDELNVSGTTIDQSEIGVLDSVTPGTASASKALILDSSSNITGISSVSCGSLNVSGTYTGSTITVQDIVPVGNRFIYTKNTANAATFTVQASTGEITTIGDINMSADKKLTWVDDNQYISGTATGITIETDDTLVVNADTSVTVNAPTSIFTHTANADLTIKSSNTSDGEAHLTLISDNGANAGDGFQFKSVNGVLTLSSDHNSSGTYGETILTITGNDTASSRTVVITGNLEVSDGNITNVGSIACDSIVVDDAAVGLDIDFGGNTTLNKISLTDNLADALNINEGGASYMKFVTTNGSESIVFGKNSTFNGTTIANLGTVTAATSITSSAFVGALTGNATTATALATARNIGGISFNGSADIDLPGVNATGNQNTTGSAATLTNARNIGGISFNGSADIDLPGVNATGNQNTTGNAATATVATTVTITDNESTNEDNAIIFTAGGDVDGGNLGLESDGNLTYNPSTGLLTTTKLNGLYVKSGGTNFTNSILLRTDGLGTATLSSAINNIGIGNSVFSSLTAGDYNVGIGNSSLYNVSSGAGNVSMGHYSLYECVDGVYNIAMGYWSGRKITSGQYNVCLGYGAGYDPWVTDNPRAITTGDFNVCIGYSSDTSSDDAQKQVVIGAYATGMGDNTSNIGANGNHLYVGGGSGNIKYGGSWYPSDSRIKNNIVDIDDSSALQYVRDIPCRYYTYLDTSRKGTEQTPGFIAQEVEAVFPLAVSTDTNYIPNEYRLLTNYTLTETTTPLDNEDTSAGNYWKLTINDLTDLSTNNKYEFYFSNDITFDLSNGKNISRCITAIDGEITSFLIKEQYTHIFLYGKEITDFKRINKDKIFTLHHSAIQQIDTTLTAEQAKIATLETELAAEKAKVATLESEVDAIKIHLGL